MSDVATQDDATESPNLNEAEQQELAEMMAGYEGRGATPPPDSQQASAEEQTAVEEITDGEGSGVVAGQEQDDEQVAQPDPVADMVQRLAELKDEVRAIGSNGSNEAVRKLHGEVGNINRQLQEMRTAQAPAAAPVDDELTAAIKKAEDHAKDFPDLAGPLVDALKLLGSKAAKPAAPAAQPAMTADEVTAVAQKAARDAADSVRVSVAQESLEEEHPDWHQVRETPQFKAWLEAKPSEYRDRLNSTWNPLVVAKGLTEFKDSQRQQQQTTQQKKDRLERAIAPKGVPSVSTKSKMTEDEEIMAGYNKGAPRPIAKRG